MEEDKEGEPSMDKTCASFALLISGTVDQKELWVANIDFTQLASIRRYNREEDVQSAELRCLDD